MKKLFIILSFLPLASMAQLRMGMGAGYDASNHKCIGNINFNYTATNNAVIEAVMQPSLTRHINAANYFGMKAGYSFHNIIPSIGYYYNYSSADDKGMNKWVGVGYSLKYMKDIQRGGVFAEGDYINKTIQVITGVYIKF